MQARVIANGYSQQENLGGHTRKLHLAAIEDQSALSGSGTVNRQGVNPSFAFFFIILTSCFQRAEIAGGFCLNVYTDKTTSMCKSNSIPICIKGTMTKTQHHAWVGVKRGIHNTCPSCENVKPQTAHRTHGITASMNAEAIRRSRPHRAQSVAENMGPWHSGNGASSWFYK